MASGSESEGYSEGIRKQKSQDYKSEERKVNRFKAGQVMKGASDTNSNGDAAQSSDPKVQKIDAGYSSSVGSTKDRDHSQSSSLNSKDNHSSSVSAFIHS